MGKRTLIVVGLIVLGVLAAACELSTIGGTEVPLDLDCAEGDVLGADPEQDNEIVCLQPLAALAIAMQTPVAVSGEECVTTETFYSDDTSEINAYGPGCPEGTEGLAPTAEPDTTVEPTIEASGPTIAEQCQSVTDQIRAVNQAFDADEGWFPSDGMLSALGYVNDSVCDLPTGATPQQVCDSLTPQVDKVLAFEADEGVMTMDQNVAIRAIVDDVCQELVTEPTATPAAASSSPTEGPVIAAPNPSALQLPEGTSVIRGACTSDGECRESNFYWAPTHEAIVQVNEGETVVQHELCHAHQHWAVNGGAYLGPTGHSLSRWYSTPEGLSFRAMAEGLSWPWSQSHTTDGEDFAWTCANWYVDPDRLLQVGGPERYQWAQEHLPQ